MHMASVPAATPQQTVASVAAPQQAVASAGAQQQAVTMTKPGHLYAAASIKSKMVRSLEVGSTLYPTGVKSTVWWEVTDEIGNKGWVSSLLVALAK